MVKKQNRLYKEFPFLEEMEAKFGELGVIRVRSIPQSEVQRVKNLPFLAKDNMISYEIVEPSLSKKDECLLFCRQTVTENVIKEIPGITQSVIFKYVKEVDNMTVMSYDNFLAEQGILDLVKGNYCEGRFVDLLTNYKFLQERKERVEVSKEDLEFLDKVNKFHPEITLSVEEALSLGSELILDEDKGKAFFLSLLLVLKDGSVFEVLPLKDAYVDNHEDSLYFNICSKNFRGKVEVFKREIKKVFFIRNQTVGWEDQDEKQYSKILTSAIKELKRDEDVFGDGEGLTKELEDAFLTILAIEADETFKDETNFYVSTTIGDNSMVQKIEIRFEGKNGTVCAEWDKLIGFPVMQNGSIEDFLDKFYAGW